MEVCERRRVCMPGLSRPSRRSLGTGWWSRPSAWRTMPCGARCGPKSCLLPAGGGEGHGAVNLLRSRRYFEQALRALPHLPEQRELREQAIDLRLALRSAPFPSGDSARILGYLREAETLLQPSTIRVAWAYRGLSLVHFRNIGAYDQAIAAAQRALALATASEEGVLHALAHQRLGLAYQSQGDYRPGH